MGHAATAGALPFWLKCPSYPPLAFPSLVPPSLEGGVVLEGAPQGPAVAVCLPPSGRVREAVPRAVEGWPLDVVANQETRKGKHEVTCCHFALGWVGGTALKKRVV